MSKKTCFVIQGFGKKTDHRTGRTLDLDASYEVIKEAVEDAGMECIRADEIQHSQIIDKPMYEYILNADLVIADLSTSNVNAAYELGVRHAVRKSPTILVAEDQWDFPFDINRNAIRTYEHLGSDLGRKEAKRFSEGLTKAIREIVIDQESGSVDSPLYTFIPELQPPVRETGADTHARSLRSPADMQPPSLDSIKNLMDKALSAKKQDDFKNATQFLEAAYAMKPNDDFIVQQLALSIYKSRDPSEETALVEARELIIKHLHPEKTSDPESLGLWAAVHKRLWQLNRNRADLEQAITALERGFLIKNDYYNGINLAYLLNERAAVKSALPEDAITDYVLAARIRSKVVQICEQELERDLEDDDNKYWLFATLWEAAVGLGDSTSSRRWEQKAVDYITRQKLPDWMVDSTRQQLENLDGLLSPSPLERLKV